MLKLRKRKVMIILEGMELPRLRAYRISEQLLANKIMPIIVQSGEFKSGKVSNRRKSVVKEFFLPLLLQHLPLAFPRQLFLDFLIIPILLVIENPKLVILSIPDGSPLIPTFLICKTLRKKLVIDIRDEWEEIFGTAGKIRSIIKKIVCMIYASADTLVVVTPNFLEKYKMMNANTLLIFNGVDNSLFRPLNTKEINPIRETLGLKPKDHVIIYSGKLSPPYRLDVVLKSLKTLKTRGEREVKLLIMGKTGHKYGEKIHESDIVVLARKLGINDMVKTLPFMHHSETVKYLGIANAGIIPYDDNLLWKHTIPTKLFEFCAVGLPVIATAYQDSVLATLINKYDIGLIVKPLDYEELADKILKLKSDKYMIDRMGTNARKVASTHFDAEHEYRKYARLVKNLLYDITA